MNCVVFVTKQTLPELKAFAESVAARQKKPIHGVLLIVKPVSMVVDEVRDLTTRLGRFFERNEVVSVHVQSTKPVEKQVAAMMGMFVIQRYSFYPGHWLVVDDGWLASQPNPLSKMDDTHKLVNCANSGRATQDSGRVPIGPVIIGMDRNHLAPARTPSGESWRSRCRYSFGRTTWHQFGIPDYPFVKTVDELPKEEPPVESTQPEEKLPARVSAEAPPIADDTTIPVPADGEELPEYDWDNMPLDELKALYKTRLGSAPHPQTSRAKLISRCKQHDSR